MIIYILEAVLILTLVYVLFYVIRKSFLDGWLSRLGGDKNKYCRGRPVNEPPQYANLHLTAHRAKRLR
jgi:hypothetical protein